MISFTYTDVFATRDKVFSRFSYLWSDHHFALAFCVLAKGNDSLDFTNHGKFFRLTGLKQFSHARQPAGNIFGFGRFSWNLRHHIPSFHPLAFNNVDMGPDW